MNSSFREIIFSSFLAIFVRGFGAVSALIASICVTRSLGAEQAGYYFLVFAVVSVASSFSRVGMDNTVLRFVGSDPSVSARLLKRVALLVAAVAGVVSLVFSFSSSFIAAFFDKPELAVVIRNISPGILGLSVFTVYANALQALGHTLLSIFFLSVVLNVVVSVVVVFEFANNAAGLGGAYAIFSILVSLGAIFFFYRLNVVQEDKGIDWGGVRDSCLSAWIVILMAQLAQWSGQFMAGIYLEAEQVAEVAVSQRASMLISLVLVAVNMVVAPRFARVYSSGDRRSLEVIAAGSVAISALMAIPIVFFMLFFSSEIMTVFGTGFSEAGPFLKVLALGQLVNAVTGPVGYLLMMSGHERDMRNIALFSGGAAILLTWLLTIQYGAFGTVLGTAIAVGMQNLAAVYFVQHRLNINVFAFYRGFFSGRV